MSPYGPQCPWWCGACDRAAGPDHDNIAHGEDPEFQSQTVSDPTSAP